MRKRHDAEGCKAAERYSKVAAVLPTVDTNTRRLGMGRRGRGTGGGRGVLPKRLKYGFSDHLSEVCAFLWPYVAIERPLGLLRLAVLFPQCPLGP